MRTNKRKARVAAVQVYYAYSLADMSPRTMLEHLQELTQEGYDWLMEEAQEDVPEELQENLHKFTAKKLTENQREYVLRLLNTTIEKRDFLEKQIHSRSKNWDPSRVALINMIILTLGICEMLYMDDIPPKVSITESVEITRQFNPGESRNFVNGIMDAIYNDYIKGKLLPE